MSISIYLLCSFKNFVFLHETEKAPYLGYAEVKGVPAILLTHYCCH